MRISDWSSDVCSSDLPETGRKGLYVNQLLTLRFKDMTEAESAPLLAFLCEHAVRPEFTCRFRWATGSIAFWANRCIQHYALNDYAGQRRWMHRIPVKEIGRASCRQEGVSPCKSRG